MPRRARRYMGSRVTSRPSSVMRPASAGDQAGDHVEHGGLAGAVGAQQADRLAAARGEADALHDHAAAIALLHVDGGEPALSRHRSLPVGRARRGGRCDRCAGRDQEPVADWPAAWACYAN